MTRELEGSQGSAGAPLATGSEPLSSHRRGENEKSNPQIAKPNPKAKPLKASPRPPGVPQPLGLTPIPPPAPSEGRSSPGGSVARLPRLLPQKKPQGKGHQDSSPPWSPPTHLTAELPAGADAQRPRHLLPLGQRQQQVGGDEAGPRRPSGGRGGGAGRRRGAEAIRGAGGALGQARPLGSRSLLVGAVGERRQALGRGAAAAGGRQEERGGPARRRGSRAAHGGSREKGSRDLGEEPGVGVFGLAVGLREVVEEEEARLAHPLAVPAAAPRRVHHLPPSRC